MVGMKMDKKLIGMKMDKFCLCDYAWIDLNFQGSFLLQICKYQEIPFNQ